MDKEMNKYILSNGDKVTAGGMILSYYKDKSGCEFLKYNGKKWPLDEFDFEKFRLVKMKKLAMQDYVWLTGSKMRITRSIYTDGIAFYVKWYGQYIQVRQDWCGGYPTWRTVESY